MEDFMINFSKIFLIFLTSILFISPVISGTIDPLIPDTKYLEYGEKFHYVVKICGSYKDKTLFCASAVVIDDNHILTAAHVVNNCEVCYVDIKDKRYLLSKVIINKNFDETFGVGDIAIGYCEEKFNLDFYPELYTDNDEVGKICSLSGYGLTGTFNTGSVVSDQKRRAGSNKITTIDRDILICDPSPRSSKDYTSLEFFIASGDSGGGLFVDNKLAGINSCVMISGKRTPRSRYGEESGHTRVSKFIEWINENKTKVD